MDITNFSLTKKKILSALQNKRIPDIFFLNAGTNNPNKTKIFDFKETQSIFNSNFFGAINCIEVLLPLIKNKKAQLIIMSSVAGYRGLPFAASYCSSKAALINFAESIHNQCEKEGIKVRLVNPGFIKTPLTDKNDFPMPLIISSQKASKILFKKFVHSNSFEISLPKAFCFFMKLLRVLPYPLYLSLTKKLLKKL